MKRSIDLILFLIVMVISFEAVAKYSGGNGSITEPFLIGDINDITEMANSSDDWDNCFVLINDINLSTETYSSAVIAPDNNNVLPNYQGTPFTGIFDGNDNTISNLTISGNNIDFAGLFGEISSGSVVKNLSLVNINLDDPVGEYHGGIAGFCYDADIINCNVSGIITAFKEGGSIVGNCYQGRITNCQSQVTVSGFQALGGIAGTNYYGLITGCSSEGDLNAESNSSSVGGLVGINLLGTVEKSFALGNVKGDDNIQSFGGLVGLNDSAAVKDCYAKGNVTGLTYCSYLGGLIGEIQGSISVVENCYSIGSINGGNSSIFLGGLIGGNPANGDVNNCFWDVNTAGTISSDGGIGKSTTDMKDKDTYFNAGWDFAVYPQGEEYIWVIDDGMDYPEFAKDANYYMGSGTEANPYTIAAAKQLIAIQDHNDHWQGYFVLAKNIDLAGYTLNKAIISWDHINGNITFDGTIFEGVFDGKGNQIKNMNIVANESGAGFLGLIGFMQYNGTMDSKGVVKNIGIVDYNIVGSNDSKCLGGICGYNFHGTIKNSYVTGTISSGDNSKNIGALCGVSEGGTSTNVIEKCYANCSIITGDNTEKAGGFAGVNGGDIINCYCTSSLIVGANSVNLGGFCGEKDWGWIIDCYSNGTLIAGANSINLGGFCGFCETNSEWVVDCFWDIQTSKLSNSDGGTGKTTDQMKSSLTFYEAGWDMASIWVIADGQTCPALRKYNVFDTNFDNEINLYDFSNFAENWLSGTN